MLCCAKVQDIVAPALESLQQMLVQHGPGTFDFAFLGTARYLPLG
jgi:hypothetical protein